MFCNFFFFGWLLSVNYLENTGNSTIQPNLKTNHQCIDVDVLSWCWHFQRICCNIISNLFCPLRASSQATEGVEDGLKYRGLRRCIAWCYLQNGHVSWKMNVDITDIFLCTAWRRGVPNLQWTQLHERRLAWAAVAKRGIILTVVNWKVTDICFMVTLFDINILIGLNCSAWKYTCSVCSSWTEDFYIFWDMIGCRMLDAGWRM